MEIAPQTSENIDFVPRPTRPAERMAAQVASIRHWPASGGGILMSARISALMGDSGALRNIDTFYLRIDHRGALAMITPYVALRRATTGRLLSFVDDELLELADRFTVPRAVAGQVPSFGTLERLEGTLDFATEIAVRACSATLATLLAAAAPPAASIPEVAALAALEPRPPSITLRSGLDLALSQGSRRQTRPKAASHQRAGGLHD